MIVKCAWCPATIGTKPGRSISHGICESCMQRYFPEYVEDKSHGMGQPGGDGLGNQEPKTLGGCSPTRRTDPRASRQPHMAEESKVRSNRTPMPPITVEEVSDDQGAITSGTNAATRP